MLSNKVRAHKYKEREKMKPTSIDRREALKLLGLGFSSLYSLGLPGKPLLSMPVEEKYPVQFVAVGFDATFWLKFIVENHQQHFRTVALGHYPVGMEQSWVDCHIEIAREERHGLPAYPETWENAVSENLTAISSELQNGKKNVVMAALGDYFADGAAPMITRCSIIDSGIPTLALVTLPAPVRGKRRGDFAAQALEELRGQRQLMPLILVNQTPVRQALTSLIKRLIPSTS